ADRAGRRDVVGRDRVAELDEAAGAGDVLDGSGLARHAVEIGRQPHVRRVWLPREQLARGRVERTPAVVAGEDVAVRRRVHRAVDRRGDRLVDLGRGRPDVAEVDRSVDALAERLVQQV